jgi:lysyl-tRNA synthetase class 2
MNPLIIPFSSFIQEIRTHFLKQGFIEIYAPPLTDLPCMETHLRPFQLCALDGAPGPYLFTSPEFYLKECLLKVPLSALKNGIFTFAYSFRNDPHSPIHRKTFLMLEWYALGQSLNDMGQFIESWLQKKITKITMRQCVLQHTGVDYFEMKSSQDWIKLFKLRFPHLLTSKELSWDDYFHLLFLNHVEPKLKEIEFLYLTHYPAQMRALAKLTPGEPESSLRAELFVNGVEVGNGYEECTARVDYETAYQKTVEEKHLIYKEALNPEASKLKFFNSFQGKELPGCSGMAIGVERLFQTIKENNFFTSHF